MNFIPRSTKIRSLFSSLALAAVAAAIPVASGCAPNPADDVPEAAVREAAVPASSTEGAATAGSGKRYRVAAGSKIDFIGSKVIGSHAGGFKKVSGGFSFDGTNVVGDGNEIEIDMASTWADDDRLAKHLKSADFFDVSVYPVSTFAISSVKKNSDTNYVVAGDLTLRGVTKQVAFPATIDVSGDTGKLEAEFSIKRFDFEIRYPGKPDNLIRDEVVIKLDLNIEPAARDSEIP